MKQVCWIALLLGFLQCGQKEEAASGGYLVIIGGGDRPKEVTQRIIDLSGIRTAGYGVILPMSSSIPDSSVYYAREPFVEAGISQVKGLHFQRDIPFPVTRIDSLRKAKLIYITGGDQSRFMDVVNGTIIADAIRTAYEQGAVIAGTSAGAAVMAEIMFTGNALKHPEYQSTFETVESGNLETRPGLGLLKTALIDQHFLIRSRHNRLITGVLEHPELLGIGIDESTAVVVHGTNAEVIGSSQVITYRNRGGVTQRADGKLGATDVMMRIYLAGDKFDLLH